VACHLSGDVVVTDGLELFCVTHGRESIESVDRGTGVAAESTPTPPASARTNDAGDAAKGVLSGRFGLLAGRLTSQKVSTPGPTTKFGHEKGPDNR
jgi:hypothetical protein